MANTIQIRIDDKLKVEATEVYEQLGIDLSTAIRMFLKKSVAVNGIPFDVKNDPVAAKAKAAVYNMRQTSENNGNSNMTLEEINDEIKKYRKERNNK